MPETHTPENILAALTIVEDELPGLIGLDWSSLSDRYEQLKAKLSNENEKWLASVEVIELLAPYDAARERLDSAIYDQDLQSSVTRGMANIANQVGATDGAPAELERRTRGIMMQSSTEASSIKLGNLSFDFGEMSELAAGIITSGSSVTTELGAQHYVLVAAGVLLIARSLYKAMRVDLSEREATVFYGFAKAVGEDKIATLDIICTSANKERKSIGLKVLNKAEVTSALHKLVELKSVRQVESKADTWIIIEKYRLKG